MTAYSIVTEMSVDTHECGEDSMSSIRMIALPVAASSGARTGP